MKIFHTKYGWIKDEKPEEGDKYLVAHGGKLVDGVLVGYGSHTAIYTEAVAPLDEVTLTIEGDKAYNVMKLGETLNFTVTFSDLTLNVAIPVSIVNRENFHVANSFITIKDGIGKGTFTPDKALDYFVTEAAINFHKDALNKTLLLAEPFFIRVVQT